MLKFNVETDDFGLTLKPVQFCHTNRLNMSNHCRKYVDTSIPTNFPIISTCFFDITLMDAILMNIFVIISMDGKSTQLQGAFFDVLLKDEKPWFQNSLLITFRYYKNGSRLTVPFQLNLISMCFSKVISFHLETSQVIIQCLRTVTPSNICSDLICVQLHGFLADILSKFPRNGQKRRPSSGSFRFMKNIHKDFHFSVTLKAEVCNNVLLIFFLQVESCLIEIRVLLSVTLQKELP